jgi:hypothetical protein
MALGESLLFYLLIGLAVGAAVVLSDGVTLKAIAAVFFWPLFVPMLLARDVDSSEREPAVFNTPARDPEDDLARSIALVDGELVAALASLDGWAEGAIARERVRINDLRAAWRAQAKRIRDIDRVLATVEVEPRAKNGEASDKEGAGREQQASKTRRENYERLRRVRDQADSDLATTLASVRELVSMIHLAKFTGEPASRAEELVTQIAAAVEGLSEVAAWSDAARTT